MTSKSSVATAQQRREALREKSDRRDRVNELVGLYIQLADAPEAERALLRDAIYAAQGVKIKAVTRDAPEATE